MGDMLCFVVYGWSHVNEWMDDNAKHMPTSFLCCLPLLFVSLFRHALS